MEQSKNIDMLETYHSTMTSNLLVKRGYLILAHLMNGEAKTMRMPSYSKKNSNAGMTRESKSVSFKSENMFFCTTLVSDSLQENSSQNGKAHMLSRRFIGLEP